MTDQCGRTISVPKRPNRIISLVPSQTELLYDLGCTEEVVAITKFCTHPVHWYRSKTRIGGTKDFDTLKIRALNPDLIIANKEENDKDKLEELAKEFPVWISDVRNLDQAMEMILQLGEMADQSDKAMQIIQKIKDKIKHISIQNPIRTAYLIWNNPMMSINQDTFIHDMLQRSGFENVFQDRLDSRYPMITAAELTEAQPDLIMLSSEPFPFGEKHIDDFRIKYPNTQIKLTDGRNWSWYGSALTEFDPAI
jgi:ABC-type Fe3+-hydroxamate transport system substrate-binding protein